MADVVGSKLLAPVGLDEGLYDEPQLTFAASTKQGTLLETGI
jgi:hypothetical protein